jgi:hypothetical protein
MPLQRRLVFFYYQIEIYESWTQHLISVFLLTDIDIARKRASNFGYIIASQDKFYSIEIEKMLAADFARNTINAETSVHRQMRSIPPV